MRTAGPACAAGDVRVQLVRLQAQLHDRVPAGAREELSLPGAHGGSCARLWCRVVAILHFQKEVFFVFSSKNEGGRMGVNQVTFLTPTDYSLARLPSPI